MRTARSQIETSDPTEWVRLIKQHVEAQSIKKAAAFELERRRIVSRCMDDPVYLAGLIAEMLEPGFVFTDCHAEWMRFASDPPPTGGQALRMLLAPRTHGKTTIANLCSTVNALLHDPDIRILIASNTDAQAEGFVKQLKRLFENKRFISLFGDLRGGVWKSHELSISGGTRISKEANVTALGMGCSLPSRHFNRIVLDDIIDEDDVGTEGQRRKTEMWYYDVLEPALVTDGVMLIIGTRWHYYDLYGKLMSQGGFESRKYRAIIRWSNRPELWDQWGALSLSVDPAENVQAARMLEDRNDEMMEGTEVLLGDVWNYAALIRKRMRKKESFERQYQNDPKLSAEESIFKEEDLRYYDPNASTTPSRNDFLCVITAHDLAISLKETADYTAWVTVGVMEKGLIYVLDAGRNKFTIDDQLSNIQRQYREFRDERVVIETVQFQAMVAQILERWTNLPIEKFSPAHDKGTRARQVSSQVEMHRVLFDRRLKDLIRELTEFPFSDHDDLFDAFVMALNRALSLAGELRLQGSGKAHVYAG